jgi:hypothetical protein
LPKILPPQVGQNPRLKVLPLSARLSKYFISPVMAIERTGTANAGTYAPPLAFRQSRQRQLPLEQRLRHAFVAHRAA